jgi:hypothetical protein
VAVKGLNCPNCGAALEIRGFEHTLSVVCAGCHSILDAKDPNFQVLQQFQERERIKPLIPLGSRGKLHGDAYEVIGFQQRTIEVDGVPYSWYEYLLFNPYKGFRYLTEYNGHWNDVKTAKAVPTAVTVKGRPGVSLLGETYLHFQTAEAETTYVLGEFPWQVRVGERATVQDFISPPRLLSAEITGNETVWSLGEYTTGQRVWEIFQLKGAPPPAIGTFANQPSPYKDKSWSMWITCLALLLLVAGLAGVCGLLFGQEEVFRRSYSFTPNKPGEASFVTQPFELKGRTSNVELSIRTDLANNWAYFNFALINEATGEAYDFGREVSYYSGRDSDGSWTEGSPGDRVLIPSIPAGRYYLRVEPEMDPAGINRSRLTAMSYELRLRRDVPAYSYFWITALLLLVPPAATSLRAAGFEQARWAESDHAPAGSGGDDSGDGDDE